MKNEKIALITGATEGIGKATAIGLAKQGYQVVLHGRSQQKAKTVQQEVIAQSGNQSVDILLADLSSLRQVKRLAETFQAKYKRLDVLVNNAGLMMNQRTLTDDGYEMNFAVNYLAHFLLTNLLLESLKAAPQARIIHLTSSLYTSGKPDWEDLQSARNYSMFQAYNSSKLFTLYFALELSQRLQHTPITSNALHPGVVNTSLARNMTGALKAIFSILTRVFFISPEKGAATSLYLATSPEVESKTGHYFENKKEVAIKGVGTNIDNRQKLWAHSEKLLKNYLA